MSKSSANPGLDKVDVHCTTPFGVGIVLLAHQGNIRIVEPNVRLSYALLLLAERFFLHCATSGGRLGLSKRRFMTIPFNEITDLESRAERVQRGLLFSFKTSQYKLIWCAPDRAELDAWMAEIRASLAWENTGGEFVRTPRKEAMLPCSACPCHRRAVIAYRTLV